MNTFIYVWKAIGTENGEDILKDQVVVINADSTKEAIDIAKINGINITEFEEICILNPDRRRLWYLLPLVD